MGILGRIYNIYLNLNSSIKFSKLFRIITAASTVLLLVLSYTFFNPTGNIITNIFANIAGGSKGVHAEGTPTVSSAPLASLVTLNIDLTHPNASVELTPHDSTGTFSSSSEDSSAAFNVSTNNYTGYSLSISSSTNTGYLTNTDATLTTNNTLSSIEQVTTESDFSSTSSTNLNNKWGYKPSKYNGSDNTSFIPAPSITNPTTNSAILDTTSTYNTTTTGGLITSETNTEDIDANTYTIGLGARVDHTVATGSYETTFNLSVVGNPVPYIINYTDDTGDTSVANLPAAGAGSASGTEAAISNTIPTRTDYTLIGWCDVATTNNGTTCSGKMYSPSTSGNTSYIPIDRTSSNEVTLHALWSPTITLKTSTGISKVTISKVANEDGGGTGTGNDIVECTSTSGCTVEGLKNGKTYNIIATLASGYGFVNWNGVSHGTITNDLTASSSYTIDNGPSNIIATAVVKEYIQDITASSCTTTAKIVFDKRDEQYYTIQKLADGNCWMLDNLKLGAVALTQSLSTSNTNMKPGTSFTLPNSASNISSYTAPQINTTRYSDSANYALGQNGSGKKGVYYNYCAASAGTICNQSDLSVAAYDICPAGWRLPTNVGDLGEYHILRSKYNSDAAAVNALRLPLAGYLFDTQEGENTYFVTQFNYNTNMVVALNVNESEFGLLKTVTKNTGASIRCVLGALPTLQSATTSTLATLMPNVGDTAKLKDSRDGEVYTVEKLADNKYWMIENLRLGTSTLLQSLSTSNTNMKPGSSFTLPSSINTGFNSYTEAQLNSERAKFVSDLALDQGGNYITGTYYNYCAASAGTICDQSNLSIAAYDICPAGWRMPANIGDFGEYQEVRNSYNSSEAFVNALKLGWFGTFQGDTKYGGGRFWTAYNFNDTVASALAIGTADGTYYEYFNSSYDKAEGKSIRCVFGTLPTLQNTSANELAALMPTVGSTTKMRDSRDGEVYTITKLADGSYWMAENLRLGVSNLLQPLSTSNTNMKPGSSFTLPTPISTGFNSYTDPQVSTSGSKQTVEMALDQGGNYIRGAYYNYCAASAGTVCNQTNASVAAYDICPAGWRMLSGLNDLGEFQTIRNKYDSDAAYVNALKLVFSGAFLNDTRYSGGYYWSTYTFSPTSASVISVYSDEGLSMVGYVGKTYGMSVRCVYGELPTMQNATASTLAALMPNVGDRAKMKDSRDGEVYTISKLADNKYWMIENLSLGVSTLLQPLSTSNTNMKSGTSFALPTSNSATFDTYTAAQIDNSYARRFADLAVGQSGQGKIGTYFNYCAVSAGTNCEASGSGDGGASYDVCPAGWYMPSEGTNGMIPNLRSQYSSDADYVLALHLPLSGYRSADKTYNQGHTNNLWTSVGYNNQYTWIGYADATAVEISNRAYPRDAGLPVRCVKK